jgi:MFS family permease
MLQTTQTRASWIGPILATVLLQFVGTFALFFMPTVAPLMAIEFGWRSDAIGYLAALITVGSMAALIAVAPLIHRAGPIRSVQLGLGLCVVAFVLLLAPLSIAPVVGSLLVGLSYAPSVPGLSQVLQRFSPPRNRALIFSIKQSGGSLGGAFAGLTLPAVAVVGGWTGAVLFAIVVIVAFVVAVQPLRERTDDLRDRRQRLDAGAILSFDNLTRPAQALRTVPGLLPFALGGGALTITQGCWNTFLVTFLVAHLDYSLAKAGAIFAVMQGATIGGRLVMGWIADRAGSGVVVIRIVSVGGLVITGLLALAEPDWPFWSIVLIAAVSGVGVCGWNGVNLSEIASRAPRHMIGEAASGAILMIMLGHIVGPSAFAALLALTGRFDVAFIAAGAVSLLALPLYRPPRRAADR